MADVMDWYSTRSISGITRSDAVEAKSCYSFIPIDRYEKYVKPLKGEIGMLYGVRLVVKEG